MHVPDGYIAPPTYGLAYLIMAPIWGIASRMLRKSLSRKQVPMLALGAAFSFVVMFLNIPVMGKMTAHPTGAGLVAIVVGPWAACIGISAALLVQAVPFGDGGITTFGLNCLNLAVLMPFVSWGIFKVIGGRKPAGSRLWFASAASAYVGLIVAAAAVALEFSLQPNGYLPYSVGAAMAAMLIPHILIVAPVEAVITAAAVGYLYRSEPGIVANETSKPTKRLAIVSAIVLLLAPLGVILPARFGAGAAWGEWSAKELDAMFGHVPQGIARGMDTWKAPLADYTIGGHDVGLVGIVLIGLVGALVTIGLCWGIGKLLGRTKDAAS
jgi:cobalt/nickel transport system permease protein